VLLKLPLRAHLCMMVVSALRVDLLSQFKARLLESGGVALI
jgi:hypothetical protein